MTDQTKIETEKQRRERLAKALRENLLRRKAWQRAQEEKAKKQEQG